MPSKRAPVRRTLSPILRRRRNFEQRRPVSQRDPECHNLLPIIAVIPYNKTRTSVLIERWRCGGGGTQTEQAQTSAQEEEQARRPPSRQSLS
jgi:hypothetical protein